MRAIAGLTLVLSLIGCGTAYVETSSSRPERSLSSAPDDSAPPVDTDAAAIAAQACAQTQYERCVESVLTAIDTLPGSPVAICEYEEGQGDVVFIDAEAEAEGACSGDGLISPSRVVAVVQLP